MEPIPAQGITIQERSDVQVIKVVQDLDNYGAADLEKELKDLIGSKKYKLVVDLSKVNYVNSTAVGMLVGMAKQAKRKGGDLKVCGLKDRIRKTFDLLGASKVLEIFDTEESAIDSF
ncbi:TPA: anti-sigma factor antagonist [Candidatus Poribacteria bacterium]|nr:anti-sigma factor antagonist [Candidatus Poribacteria bacterium]